LFCFGGWRIEERSKEEEFFRPFSAEEDWGIPPEGIRRNGSHIHLLAGPVRGSFRILQEVFALGWNSQNPKEIFFRQYRFNGNIPGESHVVDKTTRYRVFQENPFDQKVE
jgi:hypothetical protein